MARAANGSDRRRVNTSKRARAKRWYHTEAFATDLDFPAAVKLCGVQTLHSVLYRSCAAIPAVFYYPD